MIILRLGLLFPYLYVFLTAGSGLIEPRIAGRCDLDSHSSAFSPSSYRPTLRHQAWVQIVFVVFQILQLCLVEYACCSRTNRTVKANRLKQTLTNTIWTSPDATELNLHNACHFDSKAPCNNMVNPECRGIVSPPRLWCSLRLGWFAVTTVVTMILRCHLLLIRALWGNGQKQCTS